MRMNSSPVEAYQSEYVSAVFQASGLNERSLGEINLPRIQLAGDSAGRHLDVPYVSIGEQDAPNVHIVATPMFTRLTPHFLLRLVAKQAVLREDYRVLGVEAYNPETFRYDGTAKRLFASGSFAPLSARIFDAAIDAGVKYQQEVTLEGYSLGADIATQTAHDNEFNESRGVLNVAKLGVTEAARTSPRSRASVLSAFGESDNDLGHSIIASNVPALFDAWNVDPSQAFGNRTNRILERAAAGGLFKYLRSSGTANIAILKGFASDASVQQLRALAAGSHMRAYVARTEDSTVFPAADFAAFEAETYGSWRVVTGVEPGDHSSDDNIRFSAARSLFLAKFI